MTALCENYGNLLSQSNFPFCQHCLCAYSEISLPVGQQRLVQVEACGDPDEFSWRTVRLPKVD